MTPEISVVVCTYNRAMMLNLCMKSLLEQTLAPNLFEIIIVDNGSTDNTREMIQEFSKRNIYYYFEPNSGLSFARNRGIREAKGKYIAFIDDDARADPNWLSTSVNLIHKINPKPNCFGGPILPFYTSTKPVWFEDKYEIRKLWNTPRYLSKGDSFSGSNMIWEKETLVRIGGFDINTGMQGNKLWLGEETDAAARLWATFNEAQFYYSPDLIVYHWVPSMKMKVGYRLKRKFIEGRYQGTQIKKAKAKAQFVFLLKTILSLFRAIFHSILSIFSYNYIQNWAVEEGNRLALYAGILSSIFIKNKNRDLQ